MYRPASGRWLSQGQSQQLESQSQRKASPRWRGSVAKARRRLGEGVAQPGRRQLKQY